MWRERWAGIGGQRWEVSLGPTARLFLCWPVWRRLGLHTATAGMKSVQV